MERKTLIKANKKRRLQIFRDRFFDPVKYEFYSPKGASPNCLASQMSKAAGIESEFYMTENKRLTAEFFGLSYSMFGNLRYGDWEEFGVFSRSRTADDAVKVLTELIKRA